MTPSTDIIIPIRLTREFPIETVVFTCIQAVKTHTLNFRLIFVDDNSDVEGSKFIQELAAMFANSIVIKTHHQRWFTRAVNLGLRLARTPWVVSLNCDAIVDTNWLDEMYAVKDEVEQSVGKVGLVGSIYSPPEQRRYAISNNPDYVTGHAWLLNMQALYEVSASRGTPGIYLDETQVRTIHIHSDVDICWDLNRLGYQCIKSFKSLVGHDGGKTWGHQLGRIPCSLDVVNERYE